MPVKVSVLPPAFRAARGGDLKGAFMAWRVVAGQLNIMLAEAAFYNH